MARYRRGWGTLGISLALSMGAGVASARSEAEVLYTQQQTFSAALRYLRVDLAYEVTEKDPDAAYLLFTIAPPSKNEEPARGSIEVVQRDDSVRVLVSLPKLPGYQEDLIKRGLLQKLQSEYGEPPRRKKPRDPESEPKPEEGEGIESGTMGRRVPDRRSPVEPAP
jgi:hypothetical protein